MPAAWAGGAEPLSVIDAYTSVGMSSVALSPDGKHVAAIASTGASGMVVMIDTDTLTSRTIITSKWVQDGFYKVKKDPFRVRWITSEWLAVDYPFSAEAVDLTGRRVADLGTRSIGKAPGSPAESPLMVVYDDDKHESLAIVDMKTRKKRSLSTPGSGRLVDWAFDDQGQLRVAAMANSKFWEDKTLVTWWYLPVGTQQWRQLEEVGITDEHWSALRASSRSDELVISSSEGRDTRAIFTYDPIKRVRGEMLAGHPTQDIRIVDDLDADEYRGVVTYGMKPLRYWFDGKLAGLQAAVDQALPQRVNVLSGNPEGLVLVFSYGDVDPGRWFLLDVPTMNMRPLLVARSRLDPAQMRPMEVISYAAPDGLQIPAYLTRPAGDGPKPMVVLVHGGPAVRDEWDFDPEVQLLASRGYVVFQPQFRGSAGFGKSFQQAGYGQWGLAMQDDITAGVEHLVKQGVADSRRICIYGASYGGYAAVWGLAKTPELYRCGVTLAGVSDIEYMLTDWSDSNADKSSREWMRFTVGDRQRDRAKFEQVSPLKHADRIRAPLLIAHGDDDARVPMSHAKKLMKALDAQGKPYEWVMLDNEGHGIHYLRSQYKFSNAMLAFLDKHIGAGSQAAVDSPPVAARTADSPTKP
ncbi:alpha/beta hydrolase family protein [Ideonella sp. YS5]|uniref:alpha/beta hydrolase family protein n=1 Tax=Ideonella sp. YS5 TaxID=3453714 RepID=UPI003F6EEDF2